MSVDATEIGAATAALTGDGDAAGFVTVADNTPFYPGARVWVSSSAVAGAEFQVTELSGTTKIGLRIAPAVGVAPNYGRNSMVAYTVANTAMIHQDRQVVRVRQSFSKMENI